MFTNEIFEIAVLVSVIWSSAMADCAFRGNTYVAGPIESDNPCDDCICLETGKVNCAIIDCYYPLVARICPDGSSPLRRPGECCPTCHTVITEATL